MANLNRFKANKGLDNNSNTITNVADPVDAQDAATKAFSTNAGNMASGTLAVARGGTGTGTAFTAGSVVFAGASGVYSQDNSNLFWNDTDNSLGIGVSPATRLDVQAVTTTGASFGLRVAAGTNASDYSARFNNATGTTLALLDGLGNLGIGTSSPTSFGAGYTSLSVNNTTAGVLELMSNGVSQFRLFGNGSENRLQGVLEIPMTFFTNSTEKMRLDSSGNLGIGTSSPAYKLDVYGSGSPVMAVRSSASGDAKLYLECAGTNSGYVAYNRSLQALTFSGNNTTNHAVLDSAGNLGVGVTPSDQSTGGCLVLGTGKFIHNNSFGRLWMQPGQAIGSADYAGLYGVATTYNAKYDGGWKSIGGGTASAITIDEGIFSFSSSQQVAPDTALTWTTRLMINGSGNVGVGTTSPSEKLHVAGNIQQNNANYLQGKLAAGTATRLFGLNASDALYVGSIDADHTGGTIFVKNGIAQMTLDSSGNLGLGVTPSAWGSNNKAIDVGSIGGVAADAATMRVANNTYIDSGSTVRYKTTAAALLYGQNPSVGHFWSTAPSGTAGNPITFTQAMTLDASGNLLVNQTSAKYSAANRGLIEVNGTSSALLGLSVNNTAAGYLYSTSTNLYVGAPTGYNILFDINGEKMRLDPSGNLGIGTASPAAKLDVGGNTASAVQAIFARGVSDPNFQLAAYVGNVGSAAGTVMTRFGQSYSSAAMNAGFEFLRGNGASDGAIHFVSGGAATMHLDSSGNLGLGVTPSAWSNYKAVQVGYTGALSNHVNLNYLRLESNSFNGGSGETYIQNGPATKYAQNNGAGIHAWYTAPSGTAGAAITFTQAMTLDASGNLGIGTASPSARIHVDRDGPRTLSLAPANRTAGSGSYILMGNSDSGGATGPNVIVSANRALQFGVGTSFNSDTGGTFTEYMRLESTGALLVGTQLGGWQNVNGQSLEGSTGYAIFNHANGTASGTLYAGFGYNGVGIGTITQNGTTAVAYNTSSDYRLKDITGPITNSGAYIDSLNPVEGTWKADGSTFVGLIAHEVQEVSRTTVATGEKDGEQMQAMDYSNSELIANLIAEMQSLRARVAALEK